MNTPRKKAVVVTAYALKDLSHAELLSLHDATIIRIASAKAVWLLSSWDRILGWDKALINKKRFSIWMMKPIFCSL